MMLRIFLSLVLISIVNTLFAQDVLGKWKTIDDDTGKAKSIVEITMKDGKLYGTILQLFRTPDEVQDPICDECTDDRKDQRVIGMEIIRDMVEDGDEWEDGTICDPKDGKVYSCKLWIDEDNPQILNVRGYIAFFYRTQYWQRVPN
jgi:uncharacterized protein (DUF2147 family)